MISPTFTDQVDTDAPLFGPGFTGGSWVSGAAPLESYVLKSCSGSAVPAKLFQDITAFCAHIPAGGFVGGYVGYEAAAAVMPDLALPMAPDGLPIVHLVKYARAEKANAPLSVSGEVEAGLLPALGAKDYEPKVRAVIEAVLEGEIFQANISRRLSAEMSGDEGLAKILFARLIAEGPAPYAAFLPVQGGAVMSNSPELFLSVDGVRVAAEPVKGTAPRSKDPVTDRAIAEALQRSEKDRAENIMIADLMRNDLAKVCQDHSISEPAICELRSLPAVHHLYSRIEGTLRDGQGPIDALAAAFPCGSITGAPKHRAMQVISRLEGEGRGPYCGSVVYVPASGPAVFSVAIRTAVLSRQGDGHRLDYRTGGGVTALSDPAAEYAETEDKAYGFAAMVR